MCARVCRTLQRVPNTSSSSTAAVNTTTAAQPTAEQGAGEWPPGLLLENTVWCVVCRGRERGVGNVVQCAVCSVQCAVCSVQCGGGGGGGGGGGSGGGGKVVTHGCVARTRTASCA